MRTQYLATLARASLAIAVLGPAAACTPDIASGSYLCGPDGACPEGQACNGPDNVCVLPSQVQPFECDGSLPTQQDIDMECVSSPFQRQGCIIEGDTANWVTFVAPSVCTAVEVQARLSFPTAFADLGIELVDTDRNMTLATDAECTTGADTGEVRRCLDFQLVPGTAYRITVSPTGEGTCDGACPYNRYTLRVQLATPG
jgi:hypothetical protein